MAAQSIAGRGPKYRTSCDSCQATKVKCGQEKPSCRRCTVQELVCVYSLSRRMGRPRAKRNPPNESALPQSNVTSADKTTSTSPTLVAASADSERAITETSKTVTDTNMSNGPSSSEIERIPESWSGSPDSGSEPSNPAENVQSSEMPPMTNSFDFLQTFSPKELDDPSTFPLLPYFLADPLTSSNTQTPISATSTDLFDLQDIRLTGILSSIQKNEFDCMDFQPSSGSSDGSALGPGQHPEQLSQTDSTSGSNNTTSSIDIFDFSSEFPSDMGNISNIPGGSTSPRRYSFVSISPEEDSWPVSDGLAISDRKGGAQCTCASAILQLLGSLKDYHQKANTVRIDSALAMESEVKNCVSRLHHCQGCRYDSSTQLLGLMCVRLVLDLMQKAVRKEFVSRPSQWTTNSSSRGSGGHLPSPNINSAPSPESQQSSAGSSVGIKDCNLYIGSFKVIPRVRSRFLHRVLQARLHRLSLLVSDWVRRVGSDSGRDTAIQDCFVRAASVLLKDIGRVLKTVVGWVELGSAKRF